MNLYEAMFLFDPTFGATFENCEAVVRRLMDRAEAEILFCRKWDERRLAYRIKGRKRGVYVLVLFKAPANRIKPLERDAQINEEILRLLILRAEGVTPEALEQSISEKAETRIGGDESRPVREVRSRSSSDAVDKDESNSSKDDMDDNAKGESDDTESAREGESTEVH